MNPKDQQWYEFNDSKVTGPKAEDEIIDSDAYVLFYRRADKKSRVKIPFESSNVEVSNQFDFVPAILKPAKSEGT